MPTDGAHHGFNEDAATRALLRAPPPAGALEWVRVAVHAEVGTAVERARSGAGPSFIECKTYRYHGHFLGDDPLRYRTAEEEAHYRARDCIERFERVVREHDALPEAELSRIDEEAQASVEAAVEFAQESPPPAPSELTTDVYTGR